MITVIIITLGIIIFYIFMNENETINFMNKYETINFINENENIYFMNKNETINFINEDRDNYIKNMSKYDLYARKVSTYEEYIKLIINGCLNFTEEQKKIIINNIPNKNKYYKFALIDNIYEEGFPHTRKDIIFLSPNIITLRNNSDPEDNLKKIINHELIHIDQRYNGRKYDMYTISRNRNTEPLIRANPDLDDYIYKNKNGIEFYYIYSNEKPFGINDIIKINNIGEHPYELEAYDN